MRLIKFRNFLFFFLIFNFPLVFFAQIPSTHLKLWLQGDSNVVNTAGSVSVWNDISGNSFSAIQPNSNARPIVAFDNQIHHNSLDFDGTNDMLLVDFGQRTPQPNTYFIVWKTESNTSVQIPFASATQLNALLTNNNQIFMNGGSGQSFYAKTNPFNYIISTCVFKGATSQLYENGVLKNTKNTGTNSLDSLLEIGGLRLQALQFPAIPGWFNGKIAEFIMYDSILSSSERMQVEAYLANRYSTDIDLGPDLSACATSKKIGLNPLYAYTDILWSNGIANQDSITITQNGTYWVTAKQFGLTFRDTIVVSGIIVNPIISLNNDTTLCFGDSLIINYTPSPGFSPIWNNGQTSNSIVVKDYSQSIQISHSDTNSCTSTSEVYVVQIDSLALLSSIGDDRNICNGGSVFATTSSSQGPFNYLWSTGDTLEFTIPPLIGAQNISIEMTDFNQCSYSDTIVINMLNLPAPIVDFSFDTVCPSTPTSFLDLSVSGGTDNIVHWNWKFTSADSSSFQNPNFSFSEGVYNVNLTVTTDSNCVNSLSKVVRTFKQPHAKVNDGIFCEGSNSLVSSSATISFPDLISNYTWNIEGQNYFGNTISFTPSTSGILDFKLTVISDKACIDSTTKTIEIFPSLAPNFEIQGICLGDSSQFIDLSPGFSTIDKLWTFGLNNQISTEENPKFYYPSADSFLVSLTLTNALSCVSTVEKWINIHKLPIPLAALSGACSNTELILFDQSLVEGGVVSSMTWQILGDSYSNDSITVSFANAGTYPVFHSIVDNFQCANDTIIEFEINASPNIDFDFSPKYGTAPIEINFMNTGDLGLSYLWDFGDDNAVSQDENPSHTYNQNGNYNIKLSASNIFNCSDSLIQNLIIFPTELDLELSNLSVEKTVLADGKISLKSKVLVKNIGSRLIENIEFLTSVENETKLGEHWEGLLEIGQAFVFEFSSYFTIPNENLIDYLCVEATLVSDNSETLLNNNKVCAVQNGLLQSSEIYPSPSSSLAYIDIVAKNNGSLSFQIFDQIGKMIEKQETFSLEKGYNKLQIDCTQLQAGRYLVTLIYQDETYTRQLIITQP